MLRARMRWPSDQVRDDAGGETGLARRGVCRPPSHDGGSGRSRPPLGCGQFGAAAGDGGEGALEQGVERAVGVENVEAFTGLAAE